MKRIAVVGDSHFDEHSRFEECIRIHEWIADDIERRGVDLTIHTGDVYERKSTPRERTAAAAWVQRVADVCPMVIVRGNHDALGDLEVLGRLERRHPIVVEEKAAVHVLGGVAVAALAWPRKSELLATLGQVSHLEGEQAAGQVLRNILLGLGHQLADHPGPKVLAMHAMVRGSVTSTGQPLVGCDMEIGLEDLALAGADFYALGHIHKGQEWEIAHADRRVAPIVYPGSPRRTAFGELEAKGYVLVEIDDAGGVTWQLVETPATPMVLVEDEWGVDSNGTGWMSGLHGEPDSLDGAEVRFRYYVDADQRDAARAAARDTEAYLRGRGAVHVKVEEVVRPQTRARAPELSQATTLAEKLQALWAARRDDIPEERRARLLAKLAQVEEAHRAA